MFRKWNSKEKKKNDERLRLAKEKENVTRTTRLRNG